MSRALVCDQCDSELRVDFIYPMPNAEVAFILANPDAPEVGGTPE